jgi:hypothetical protein
MSCSRCDEFWTRTIRDLSDLQYVFIEAVDAVLLAVAILAGISVGRFRLVGHFALSQ